MKVVLINAPYLGVYGKLNVGRNFSFPLGLGYIASVLRAKRHEVFLLDPEPLGISLGEIREYLREKKPEVVGISSATPNFDQALNMARICRSIVPKAKIVYGGVHASALGEKILQKYMEFDVLAIGEGEETMAELCNAIANKADLSEVRGIIFREADGNIRRNKPRPFINAVDLLPYPARDLVELSKYRLQVHLDIGVKSATLLSSRGCPFQCTFCASHLTLGRGFRPHSPEYVVSEITYLVENHGVQLISIVDDTFTVNKKRVQEICDILIKKKLKIKWFCFARVDTVSDDLLRLMKEAGCISLLYGVESADENVLKKIKKGIMPAQARKAISISNRLGYKTLASFMFGNPGDTKETIEKTIKFALELNPTIASFNRLVPYPGTEIYGEYLSKDAEPDWKNFVPKGEHVIMDGKGISKREIQKYTFKAFLRFYVRPSQIIRIIVNIRSISELKVYIRGAFGLLRQMMQWWKRGRSY